MCKLDDSYILVGQEGTIVNFVSVSPLAPCGKELRVTDN